MGNTKFAMVEHMDMIENKLRFIVQGILQNILQLQLYIYTQHNGNSGEGMKVYQQRVKPGVAGSSSLPGGESILLVLDMRRFHERLRDDLRK